MAYGSAPLVDIHQEGIKTSKSNEPNSARSYKLRFVFICFFSILLLSYKGPETHQGHIRRNESRKERINSYRKSKNKEFMGSGGMIQNPTTILSHLNSNKTTESVVFLNEMIDHLWPYIDASAGRLIRSIVEPMFAEMLPGPFKNTRFLEIDLGTDPMFLDRIDFIAQTNDSLRLHMDVSWDAKTSIKLKSPIIGTYGCKRIQMGGRMSILLKPLVPSLPVISAIQAGFINPPDLAMDFSGIADLADVSFLRGHIYKIINCWK